MNYKFKVRISGFLIAFTFIGGAVFPVAAAQTDLESQVNKLMSELKALQSRAIVVPSPVKPLTTPGVSGQLLASVVPTQSATLKEGDKKVGVLNIVLEAQTSDVKVERIKVKLDQTGGGEVDTDFYKSIAQRIHVMNGSSTLASLDLNENSVAQEATGSYVTISGLNIVVKDGVRETLTLALDAHPSFAADFIGDSWSITVPQGGIRGVDGAGVNLYVPALGYFAGTLTSQAGVQESSDLTLTSASRGAKEYVATGGRNDDEIKGVPLATFTLQAGDDGVILRSISANISVTGYGSVPATASTTYLYRGNTLVDVARTVGSSVTFNNVGTVIQANQALTFSVRADVNKAQPLATILNAHINAKGVSAYTTKAVEATISGQASGSNVTVRNVGPEISVVSKSITYTPADTSAATSSAKANFVVRLRARGGDIEFGGPFSAYPLVAQGGGAVPSPSFVIYRGGEEISLDAKSSVAMNISGKIITSGANFILEENESIDIPVSFTFQGRDADDLALITTGEYAVALERVNWINPRGERQFSSFMEGNMEWRTREITMP